MDLKNENREQIAAELLNKIAKRRSAAPGPVLKETLSGGIDALNNEPLSMRPASGTGKPGGLIKLNSGGYFIVIPDLHARMDFFNAVMNWTGFSGRSVLKDMEDGTAQVICVGDAFHSEARGRVRWQKARTEWLNGFRQHKHMDKEMRENLGLLEMISVIKTAFPHNFHFLKGNHENIANELGEGNYPFRKFVYEGDMVKAWVEKFLDQEIFDLIYRWEKLLPLMAEGPGFLISHCEPGRALTPDEVINAYQKEDVIYNLTWVDNGQADENSASKTLLNFGLDEKSGKIFGGHRPVSGEYELRQGGNYVQINTPNKWVIAAIADIEIFKPERDIICLRDDSL